MTAAPVERVIPIGQDLAPVFGDLRFPVVTWEALIHAESYGADLGTRMALRRLPDRTFHTLDQLVDAVSGLRARTGRPAGGSAMQH